MPAHLWELRADVRPLELGAQRWDEVAALMTRRGDDLVAVARRATDAWDAASAESYEAHRRQVLAHLDRFTTLAREIAGSLRAVSSVLTSTQKQLDQSWVGVATVPHDVVGESRHLVFRPTADDERGTVTRAEAEAEEIRRRLTLSLDQEGTRLRSARGELATVRVELTTLTGGTFTDGRFGGGQSGVGTLEPSSTSVRGSAQSGIAALAPIAPLSVSMPHLTGLSSAALAPLAGTAAGGLAGGRDSRRTTPGTPPMGGMGAGAAGARAGTMSRGMASGRSGPQRLTTPRMPGSGDDEQSRLARDREAARQAEKEAKRAALDEKRAERAARSAARRAERQDEKRERGPSAARDADAEVVDGPDEDPGSEGRTDARGRAPRR